MCLVCIKNLSLCLFNFTEKKNQYSSFLSSLMLLLLLHFSLQSAHNASTPASLSSCPMDMGMGTGQLATCLNFSLSLSLPPSDRSSIQLPPPTTRLLLFIQPFSHHTVSVPSFWPHPGLQTLLPPPIPLFFFLSLLLLLSK